MSTYGAHLYGSGTYGGRTVILAYGRTKAAGVKNTKKTAGVTGRTNART